MINGKQVLITDDVHPDLIIGLEKRGFICHYRPEISLDETQEIIESYHGLIINSKILADRKFLSRAKNLQFLARLGSGLEIIDLYTAKERGIEVISSPEGNCNAVAEHALGMLLCLLNHIPQADHEVRQGNWFREKNRGKELKHMSAGIIGFGHTGQEFARKLLGMEVRVFACDLEIKNHPFGKHVEITDLKTIQNQSDIISLHVSYKEENHHLINRQFISDCSKSIYLINTSRGKVVHTADLMWSIEQGKVLGAALDVFENEKPNTFSEDEKQLYSRLYRQERVILTPHIAGWTVESKMKIAEVILQKLDKSEK